MSPPIWRPSRRRPTNGRGETNRRTRRNAEGTKTREYKRGHLLDYSLTSAPIATDPKAWRLPAVRGPNARRTPKNDTWMSLDVDPFVHGPNTGRKDERSSHEPGSGYLAPPVMLIINEFRRGELPRARAFMVTTRVKNDMV